MASSKLVNKLYPVKEHFISEEDLKETERLLKNLKCFEPKAVSNYKAWVEQREKSIEAIGCLEEKLENLHRACNAAHGLGAVMEVVGGLALVAGNILTECGHESVGEFLSKKVCPVTTATGIATTLSSSVAETGLTYMTMKEVKVVLRKDEEYTKIFMENLEHSKKIDSYLKRIFNCSILSNDFLDVVRFVKEGVSLVEVSSGAYSKFMDELKYKAFKWTDISESIESVIQNLCTTMKKISNDPEVRKAIRNICNIIQGSPLAVEFIKMGLRISFKICDILKADIFTSLLGYGILKTSTGVMATKCLLGSVLIAINVVSVISSVQDSKEGTSKFSEILKELKLALAMELNTVRSTYLNLL